jgi:S1-C subfamily serine protease
VAAALLSAAAAFAVVWTTVGSGGSGPTAGVRTLAPRTAGAAWLGADTTNFAAAGGGGALVTDVVSGGPADAAGLQPGDLITQIGSTPIASPSVIAFALAGLHPGDPVQVQFQRGLFTNTAQLVLGTQPGHHP